ncbi:hypothetical protein FQA39_LY11860 [Lamprigera yunnana]|nr:hypothetical protein FQA39_LY11860 [Lamprigera yunnana]
MGGKGEGSGGGNIMKLENQITVIKYTLLFSNVILWMIGAAIFALSLWLRFEPGLEEWVVRLELENFYIGLYILIVAGIIIMLVSFVGCVSSLQESKFALLTYIGTQAVGFICGTLGAAFLLENSTQDSQMQPLIRESMRRLIMNAHHDWSKQTLSLVQEDVGCCGADGPNDYLDLKQPVPTQCRDTVTGNSFYHGCVQELTWYFEEKAAWITGLTMVVCLLLVCNAVMGIILVQALKKEEEEGDAFRR